MEKIDGERVKQLAEQSSLDLATDEQEELAGSLNAMLEMFKPILELGGLSVEPTYCGISRRAAWREDEVSSSLPLEQVFQSASTRDRDYFKVPRITGREE